MRRSIVHHWAARSRVQSRRRRGGTLQLTGRVGGRGARDGSRARRGAQVAVPHTTVEQLGTSGYCCLGQAYYAALSTTPTLKAECPLNASAEWVVERPAFYSGFGYQIVPLAQFRNPTVFTTVTASGAGKKNAGPLAFARTTSVWQMNITSTGYNTTGAPFYDLDTTSSLNGGNGFSGGSSPSSFFTTWLNSY